MTKEQILQEKARFNALSQDDARKIAKEVDGSPQQVRSCWYCNDAHGHLKETDYFTCFACGISYVRSFPMVIIGMRMRGEEVTDETMVAFTSALDASI